MTNFNWKSVVRLKQNGHLLFKILNLKFKPKGFTLVELIVSVAIIAVFSVSSVVGFAYLEDVLKAREVTGLIADTLSQEELKVLRGDFKEAVVHFLPDYLVIEEKPEDASLSLDFNQTSCNGDYQIEFTEGDNLIQRDGDGAILRIENASSTSRCIYFNEAEGTERRYQLTSDDDFSDIIRFVHFNLQREDLTNPIRLTSGAGAIVHISAPYGKKTLYDADGDAADLLEITAETEDGRSTDTLTIR